MVDTVQFEEDRNVRECDGTGSSGALGNIGKAGTKAL